MGLIIIIELGQCSKTEFVHQFCLLFTAATECDQAPLNDSTSFLAELQASYKNATTLLSTEQLWALDISHATPFDKETVNMDFARLVEQYYTLKIDITEFSDALRRKLMQPNATSMIPDIEEHGKVLGTLNKVAKRIRKIWELKLKVTEEKQGIEGLPRIIRLACRLKLSEKETTVLLYILACGTSGKGMAFPMRPGYFGNSTMELCQTCDLTVTEILQFLHQDRVHMQQGLFPDVHYMYILRSPVKFDDLTVKALTGLPLTANEFLRLEQTHLADVIAEESGNEHYRQGTQIAAAAMDDREPSDVSKACMCSIYYNTMLCLYSWMRRMKRQ